MRLRGIEFGNVWGQSGVQNFFGEGYPYHKFWKPLGLRFNGCTFVSKTTTVHPRKGKMPMKKDGITPSEIIPKCIYIDFWEGVALNAVSLSGPGLEALLNDGRWQRMAHPFMISYMSVESSEAGRLQETREFVSIMSKRLKEFRVPWAIQRNYSCPNVGNVPRPEDEFVSEVERDLSLLGRLDVPIVVKLAVTTAPKTALKIANYDCCDAVTVSNTIPWGKLPDLINWKKLFGTDISPLQARIGMDGGLSGKPLLPLVVDWLKEAKDLHFRKPIAAGGGIMGPGNIWPLVASGADAICVGSGVSMLRPWRMQRTINEANRLLR